VEELDKPIRIGLAHLEIKLGIIIEAVEVIFNAEKLAGIPEKALDSEEIERVAAFTAVAECLKLFLFNYGFDGREESFLDLLPILLILHNSQTFAGIFRSLRSAVYAVCLQAFVETEKVLNLFYGTDFLRKTFRVPSLNREPPPGSPLDRGASVNGLSRKIFSETFGCSHN
jgi:hypothetical protein